MKMTAATAEQMELSETIREISRTVQNMIATPKPTCHDIARSTPNPVAADFPPVNRIQIERLCPITASRAAIVIAHDR